LFQSIFLWSFIGSVSHKEILFLFYLERLYAKEERELK